MLKQKLYLLLGFATVAAIIFTACTSENPDPTTVHAPTFSIASNPETESQNQVIVTDRTGRKWDVTHARDVYGMNSDYFNFGLGVGVIPSVDEPIVLEQGDPGYPSTDSRIQVFGVNHNGEQRGYSASALSRHEVFNDVYKGESNQYVAVTY